MSFEGPLSSLPKAHGPRGHYTPLPLPLSVALLSSTHWCVLYIYFPSTSLPCVSTVTGLAVMYRYVPVAGYRYHTRLALTVK